MVTVKDVQRLVRRELQVVVLPDQILFNLTTDSLELMYLIQVIEDEYNISIPDNQLTTLTPEKIVEFINGVSN